MIALSIPEGTALRIALRIIPKGIPEGTALSVPEGIPDRISRPAVSESALGAGPSPNRSGWEWWHKGAPRLPIVALLAAILLANILSACSAGTSSQMSAASSMPDMIQGAPATVREAYAFAATHPEVMQNIPCYCGCGSIGHTSNYACYIAGQDEQGAPIYDEHALGCSICVDITQDTMRLVNQGWEVSDIRAEIDRTYSQYGPSNMP